MKLNKVQFSTKDKLGYIEEFLVVEEGKKDESSLLKYSLSNSLDDIEMAIFYRTGKKVKLENAFWNIKKNLLPSVKCLMNKHKVRFSMTNYEEDDCMHIVVNMRVDDIWFDTFFIEKKGRLLSISSHYDYLARLHSPENEDDDE